MDLLHYVVKKNLVKKKKSGSILYLNAYDREKLNV